MVSGEQKDISSLLTGGSDGTTQLRNNAVTISILFLVFIQNRNILSVDLTLIKPVSNNYKPFPAYEQPLIWFAEL